MEYVKWRKPSRSGNGGNTCVELARLQNAVVATRDSTDPDGPAHRFTIPEMTTLFKAIKNGDHDLH